MTLLNWCEITPAHIFVSQMLLTRFEKYLAALCGLCFEIPPMLVTNLRLSVGGMVRKD